VEPLETLTTIRKMSFQNFCNLITRETLTKLITTDKTYILHHSYRASPVDDDYIKTEEEDDRRNSDRDGKRTASQDKIDICEERIKKNVYDTDAWTTIMSEVQSMDIEAARPYYERFFTTYPTAGRFWKQYVEAEINAGHNDKAEDIFRRSLHSCLNVELWHCYLKYVRNKEKQDQQSITQMAYEHALEHVGFDISSSVIWFEYIEYLKNLKVTDVNHVRLLRLTYQRAIGNPMHEVDRMWKEYENFENMVSKPTAKQVTTEQQPRFKAALNKYKEKKAMREGLLLNMLARPPCGSHKEEQQKRIWLNLIELEKRNTQRLPVEELQKRVKFVYQQALLCLHHYPEIWYDAAMYLAGSGVPTANDEATEMFDRACKALPGNILFHFAYADFHEARKQNDKAKAVYESLLEKKQDPIIYIQYQKFVRRTVSIEAAREVFIKARKSPDCTYHVYIASAMMEYQANNNPKVATKVFELGLKQYIHEPMYILEYLKYLEHLNDKNNQRVVYERVLNTLPKNKAHEIWNKFLEFEYSNGDPQTIEKAEARAAETYSTELVQQSSGSLMDGAYVPLIGDESSRRTRIGTVIDRFKFMDLWPCQAREMELMDLDSNNEAGNHLLVLMATTKAEKEKEEQDLKSVRQKVQKDSVAKLKLNKFKQQFYRPDVDQMMVMTSSNIPNPAERMAQIDQTLPEPIIFVLSRVPQYNRSMNVRLPDIEFVMETLRNNQLPPPPQNMPTQRGVKRTANEALEQEEEEDEDDESYGGVNRPPQNDIYRQRRAKRLYGPKT
jgi:cleavage stimulation factor subunit 3